MAANLKEQAHELIDHLPDNVSWDDIAYRIEMRASIERGLRDSESGRTVSHDALLKEFGISS